MSTRTVLYEKIFFKSSCIGLVEKFSTWIIIAMCFYTFVSGVNMWTSYMLTVHAFEHFVVRSLCSLLQTILIIHVLTIGYTCTMSLVGWTMQPIPAYNKSNVRKLGFFYSCETKLNEKQKIKLIFQTKTCNRRIKNTMQITKPFKEILIERRTSCSRIIFQPFSALISQFTF